MKKVMLVILLFVVGVCGAIALLIIVIEAIIKSIGYHGLIDMLLLAPALFVAVCYELGVIAIMKHFWPEVFPYNF